MTWLQWLGAVFGVLVMIALGFRVIGTNRWTELIRTHTSHLESGRGDIQSAAHGRLPSPMQRYLRAVLTVGQPIIGAATSEMTGKINMSTTVEQWKPFTSHQRVVTRRQGFCGTPQ